MEITEVRIKLITGKNDKLRAFCSITIDNDFVIRDLKIIEGTKGPFVAMPSRKLMERCTICKGKNHQRARYCNECGRRLPPPRNGRAPRSAKLHADIAHPINSGCREFLQSRVLEFYAGELERASQPGYRPLDMEVFDEDGLREEAAAIASFVQDELVGTANPEASEPSKELVEPARKELEGLLMPTSGSRTAMPPSGSGTALPPSGSRTAPGEALGSRYRHPGSETKTALREFGRERETPARAEEEVGYPGGSREPLHEKRRQWEQAHSEPEDNFGAGLFS